MVIRVCVVDLNGPFGPLRSYLDAARPLAELGVEFFFVVPSESAELVRRAGVPAEILIVDAPHSAARDARVGAAVIRAQNSGADVIHANSTSAARGALPVSRRLVIHLRNSKLSRNERIMLSIARELPGRRRFLAVSRSAAAQAGGRVAQSALVVPDPVASVLKRPDGPARQPPRIGIVANQQLTKGFDVFTEIARLLSDRAIEWHIFGSASDLNSPSTFVRDAQRRLGLLSGSSTVRYRGTIDLSQEYRHLDAVLVTSRRESFSRVSAEAMMAGVPLIAPSIPGLDETVDDGRLARVYPVADAQAAALCVEQALIKFDQSLQLAKVAQEWSTERFDPSRVANTLRREYGQLSVRRQPRHSRVG